MSNRNYYKKNKINLPMFGVFVYLLKNYIRIADYIANPDWLDDILSLVILVIFALSVIRKKYNIKQLVMIVIISALALYTGRVTGYMIITTTVLTMITIVDEDIDKIIWFMFCVTGLFLAFNTLYTIVLWIFGCANLGGFTEEGTRYRLHFGYGMPGHLADCILNMMLMWTWNHYKKLNIKSYTVMFLVALFSYLTTDSRVIFCISIIFIIGLAFVKHKKALRISQLILPKLYSPHAQQQCLVW